MSNSPLNIKGQPKHDRSHVALIAQHYRALQRYRKGRGFESRSKPEIFFRSFFQ